MKELKIGNGTFEFDASDMNTREKYCDALERYLERAIQIDAKYEESNKTQRDLLEHFKKICTETYSFVDSLFGDGAAIKSLGDNYNIDVCIGVLKSLSNVINEHDQRIAAQISKR